MSIFVSTTFAAYQSSVLETVRLLKKRGIFNIELGSLHRFEEELASRLKSEKCNYLTHNFFPPLQVKRLILNIASRDETTRRRSLKFIENAIDFAQEIGAHIYTIHPGFLAEPVGESSSVINYDFDFGHASITGTSRKYDECFQVFINSLDEIYAYAKNKEIIIAIETQGSINKKDYVFFTKIDDFPRFIGHNYGDNIGINLNLVHLKLASKAWEFDILKAIEILKPKIKAVEISHDDGTYDTHRALEADAWYIDILKDEFFRGIPVIFEGRNCSIAEVENSYGILENICG